MGRCRRSVELLLRRGVHPLPVLNHLRFLGIQSHHARLLEVQLLRKHFLVVLLLSLLALEVHLLDEHAPAVAFLHCEHVLVGHLVLA